MTPQPSVGAALQYSRSVLGGPLVENETNPVISNAATLAIPGNGDRVGLVLVNLSAFDMYVSFNAGVSTTNGIKLPSNGGFLTMDVVHDFTMVSRGIWAVATSAGAAMYVLELARFALNKGGGQ